MLHLWRWLPAATVSLVLETWTQGPKGTRHMVLGLIASCLMFPACMGMGMAISDVFHPAF